MIAYVLHGKQAVHAEQRLIPEPQADEVLVKVQSMGICGSDMLYFQHGRAGAFAPTRPFILGHEASGEVVEVGRNVANLAVSARVAIDPSQPCHICNYCRTGYYNLCRQMKYRGSAGTKSPTDGLFSEYVTIPARNCYPLPDQLSYAAAAMIEPLSVAVHAIKRAGMVYGSSVLITGGGTIGQLILLVARAFGAGKIALSDMIEGRRQIALSNGADLTLDPAEETMAEQALASTEGGFDIVVEASGAPAAVRQAYELARIGGTIVQVGSLPAEVSLPANLVMMKELTITGSFRFANVFQTALDMAASGRLNLQPLITHTFPMADFEHAIRVACAGEQAIKVQLEA